MRISVSSSLTRFTRDLLVVFGLLVLVQIGVVQAYVVPTGSMERTILAGELIVADKITLGPRTPQWVGIPWTKTGFHVPAMKLPGLRAVERGDIVVVEVPVDPVPANQIVGRARFVAASFSPSRFWGDPIGALRLGRWGKRLS